MAKSIDSEDRLTAAGDIQRKLFEERRAAIAELSQKFGHDVIEASLANAQIGKGTSRLLGGAVMYQGEITQPHEMRARYAQQLVKALSLIPEDQRSLWLSNLLQEVDNLEPPTKD